MRKAKTGLMLYARMMAALTEPMTAREVATSVSATAGSTRVLLCELHGMGVIHVSGWKRVGKHGIWDRVYSPGDLPDAIAPLTTLGMPGKVAPPAKQRPRAAVITFASLWYSLAEPTSTKDLAEETGVSEQTAWRFIRFCRDLKLIGVKAWGHAGTTPVAYYALGAKNKDKPRRETHSTISRRYRVKLKERERNLTLGQLSTVGPVWREAA